MGITVVAPAPHPETPHPEAPEARTEELPHLDIPGFEKLPPEAQDRYLKIPVGMLDRARPLIMAKIAEYSDGERERHDGEADQSQAETQEVVAASREAQTANAIDTYLRAARGDPKAAEDLMDAQRELLGKEPKDADIWEVVFENHSSNVLAGDQKPDEWLELYQQLRMQEVADLFDEFRGSAASADDVLKPTVQVALFEKLTEHQSCFPEKLHHMRAVLEAITDNHATGLRAAVDKWNLVSNDTLLEENVMAVNRQLASVRLASGASPAPQAL